MGNLKFDIQKKESSIDMAQQGYKILIAGSTHKGEDEIVLDTFAKLKKDFPKLKLLLAPRHPQRVPDIEQLIKNTDFTYGLRSKDDKFTNCDIIILDTLGELGKMYSICDIAFIGGLSGPSIHNFKDIYSILVNSQAGKVVSTPDELYSAIKLLLSDDLLYKQTEAACASVFEEQKGALDFVINKIRQILK